MIRFGEDRDHSQVKTLWRDVFGDSAESIDFYFSNRHENQNMLVADVDGVIAGMLTMLPLMLGFGREIRPGRYIYAVATAPTYRKQGISTQLLVYCHTYMAKNNETAAVLTPASESLFSFYGKRGYETVFYNNRITLPSSGLPVCPQDAVCTLCTVEDFYRIRGAFFSDSRLFVRWGKEQLAYIAKSAQAFGDGVYYFRTLKGEGYAFCGWRGPRIYIREIALIHMELSAAISILHQTLGALEYEIFLPEGSIEGNTPSPFGMIHYLEDAPASGDSGKPPYLALVLD